RGYYYVEIVSLLVALKLPLFVCEEAADMGQPDGNEGSMPKTTFSDSPWITYVAAGVDF
ncbi:hypothetical protein Tco_1546751, partial [Tanacetum coccineum]